MPFRTTNSVLIVLIALAAIALLVFVVPLFASSVELDDKTVLVEEGMGALEIAEFLEQTGVIRSQLPFLFYITITGNTDSLQAGEYRFNGRYAPYQVADIVTSGFSLSSEREITIPEGFTLKEIEETLAEHGVAGAADLPKERPSGWVDTFVFLQDVPADTLEGFLFPDTYRFDEEATAGVVARKMLVNFEGKTAGIRMAAEEEGKGFYEVLILASILEKEVPPEDMRRAAGVLTKRLEAGMALQTDATLVYGLGRPIKRSDIDTFNSSYNTYKFTGLPPTPISNPGIEALQAALDPEDNEFWYYLNRPDTGETIFSRTFTEHDRARAEHLR